MSEETKFCSNCDRNIAEANFVLHFLHCHRNIEICSRCSEPVPRKELGNHLEKFHAVVSCEKCEKHMEYWKLKEHEEICNRRPISCIYCELDVPWDEIKDHELYCGSRTELCQSCKSYVMIKEKEKHSKTCLEYLIANKFQKDLGKNINQNILKAARYERKEPELDNKMSSVSSLLQSPTVDCVTETMHAKDQQLFENKTLPSATGTSEYLSVRKFAYPEDNETESEDDNVSVVSANLSRLSITDNTSTSNRLSLQLECPDKNKFPHCRKVIPSSDFQAVSHYESGKLSTSSRSNASGKMGNLTNLETTHENVDVQASDSTKKAELNNAALELTTNCPICKKEFPVAKLSEHVLQCADQSETCPVCSEKVKLRDKDNHVNACVLRLEQNNAEMENKHKRKKMIKDVASLFRSKLSGTSYNKVERAMLPCEFCGEPFPDSILIEHQSACRPDLLHFPSAKACDNIPDMISKATLDADDDSKSTKFEKPFSVTASTSHKVLISEDEFESSASANRTQSKRGRSSPGHYTTGRRAVPGEFLPTLTYAGFPDCYKIYEPVDTITGIPFQFGTPFFLQNQNFRNTYDGPHSYAHVASRGNMEPGAYSKTNDSKSKSHGVGKKKMISECAKGSSQSEETDDSDKGSLYHSCESDCWSDSKGEAQCKMDVLNKTEKSSISKSSDMKSSKKKKKSKKVKQPKRKR